MEQTKPVLRPENDRVELLRGDLDEWYVNRPNGLEQGFTIPRPPEGDGPLVVAGRFSGALSVALHADLLGADLKNNDGATVLRYAHLAAFDALGNDLECWIEVDGRELRLVVDDREAIYPVTIDPLLSLPSWTANGTQTYGAFAAAVATAGDVNGDGFADILVGASAYDNGQSDEGRVYLYLGSAAGPDTSAAWIEELDIANLYFGTQVATAGDVNGDGYADVIVSALRTSNPRPNEGVAYLYLGSGAGLATSPRGPSKATRPTRPSDGSPAPATSTATATPTSSSARAVSTTRRSTKDASGSSTARRAGSARARHGLSNRTSPMPSSATASAPPETSTATGLPMSSSAPTDFTRSIPRRQDLRLPRFGFGCAGITELDL